MPNPPHPSIAPMAFGSPKQKALVELYKQLAKARKDLDAATKKRGGSRKRGIGRLVVTRNRKVRRNRTLKRR